MNKTSSVLMNHLMKSSQGTSAYHVATRLFSTRPFNILGVQQIALGSLNKGDLAKFWGDVMGLTKVTSFKSERENVDEDVLECGRGTLGKVEVDIMTPLDPEKSPKVHIPPLNHIGLWVDDLPKCVEHLESNYICSLTSIL